MPSIGLLELDILFPMTGSLKEKRQVLRSLKDRVRNRCNVSIAEVKHQDNYRRTHLAVVTVSTDRRHAESRLQTVETLIETYHELQIVDQLVTWL